MPGVIRPARLTDAPAIQQIYAPYVRDRATSFEATAPGVTEIERRLVAQGDRFPWLVFEERDDVSGYAYASPHAVRHAYQWSVNVSVYLDPLAHRRGIGRALYLSLFEILRRQGFMNAYAGITLPNTASEGLHASLGFAPIGVYQGVGFKLGLWWDVIWMHLRLRDDLQAVADPRPFPDIVESSGMRAAFARFASEVRAGA
jgi:phosphinothricin acetyltransferase